MIRQIIWIANTKAAKRRAVSQVIGSLAMMAIVASVGSVVVFQGLSGIQGFNNIITGFVTTKRDTAGEDLIIEHVQFQTSGGTCTTANVCVKLWFRNTGTVDATIKTIKIMNKNTQTIHVNEAVNIPVYVRNYADSALYDTNPDIPTSDLNKNYKISITTERGNSFSSLATSYNT